MNPVKVISNVSQIRVAWGGAKVESLAEEGCVRGWEERLTTKGLDLIREVRLCGWREGRRRGNGFGAKCL